MESKETLTNAFCILENSVDKYWDMCTQTLGSLLWSQEQFENIVRNCIEYRNNALKDGIKILEEFASESKKNQQQFQEIIQDSVNKSF